MKVTLIVILGCNILSILYDRLNTAIDFVNKSNNNSVNSVNLMDLIITREKKSFDWLLTGGSKDNDKIPEAEIMLNMLKDENYLNTNFIIDSNSTNTVENFIFLNKYLKVTNTTNIYQDVYIVTSNFHFTRAKKIADRISPKNNYKWLLGKEETPDLVVSEKYHIANVDLDIKKATCANNLTINSIKKDDSY
jgi:hypothetical protein